VVGDADLDAKLIHVSQGANYEMALTA